jgi:hypothetical protein
MPTFKKSKLLYNVRKKNKEDLDLKILHRITTTLCLFLIIAFLTLGTAMASVEDDSSTAELELGSNSFTESEEFGGSHILIEEPSDIVVDESEELDDTVVDKSEELDDTVVDESEELDDTVVDESDELDECLDDITTSDNTLIILLMNPKSLMMLLMNPESLMNVLMNYI